MFERFTNRARHVVVLAQEEARGLQHNYIGTEHILLGLLGEPGGDVLGADVVVLQPAGLLLGQDDDMAGAVSESLKHVDYSASVSGPRQYHAINRATGELQHN